jgi:hypothetical protein
MTFLGVVDRWFRPKPGAGGGGHRSGASLWLGRQRAGVAMVGDGEEQGRARELVERVRACMRGSENGGLLAAPMHGG